MTDCTYCGCDVRAHDPVFVSEGAGPGALESAGFVTAADEEAPAEVHAFCNYACLVAHVEDAELTTGATCELDA